MKHLCDNVKKQLRAAWDCKVDDKLIYKAAMARDEDHFVQAIAALRARDGRETQAALSHTRLRFHQAH